MPLSRRNIIIAGLLSLLMPAVAWANEQVPGVLQVMSMYVQLFATTSTDASVPDDCVPAASSASFSVTTPIPRCDFSTAFSVFDSPNQFGLYDACTGETRPDAAVRVEAGNTVIVHTEAGRKFFRQNIYLGVKVDGQLVRERGYGNVEGSYGVSLISGVGGDERCKPNLDGLPWVRSEGVGWQSFNPASGEVVR